MTLDNKFDSDIPSIDQREFETLARLLKEHCADITLIYAEGNEVPHSEDGIPYVKKELLAKTKALEVESDDMDNGRYVVHCAKEIPLFVDTPHGLHYLTELALVSHIYGEEDADPDEELEVAIDVKNKTYDFIAQSSPVNINPVKLKSNIFERAQHFMDLFEAFGFKPRRTYVMEEK